MSFNQLMCEAKVTTTDNSATFKAPESDTKIENAWIVERQLSQQELDEAVQGKIPLGAKHGII